MERRFSMCLKGQALILPAALIALGLAATVAPRNASAQEGLPEHTAQSALADSELPPELLLQKARRAFVARDYPGSEALYKALLIREPENVKAMMELSVIYEAQDKPHAAVGLLDRAAALRPEDREISERRAEILHKMTQALQSEIDSLVQAGAHDEAIPKLSILIQAHPGNADLYFQKARCHLRLDRPEAAKAEIAEAIRLDPAEHFLALQKQAERRIHERGVKSLEERAKRLLDENTSASRREALGVISQLQAIDPQHAWANEQYRRLSRTRGLRLGWLKDVFSSLKQFFSGVGNAVWPVVVGVLSAWNERLWVMIGILIALLVLASPLTRTFASRIRPRVMLAGNLSHFNIQEVLGLINAHQATGELRIKSPGASGSFYFGNGEIYHCECGNEKGQSALKTLMKNSDTGHFAFKRTGRVAHQTVNTPVSLILMDLPARERSDSGSSSRKKKSSRMSRLLKSGS